MTDWNKYRQTKVETDDANDEGVCAKTAPLFLEFIEEPDYRRKDLGGDVAKTIQRVLNDEHGQNNKTHAACARHLTAMDALLVALVNKGSFKRNGLVYTLVTPADAPKPDSAPVVPPADPPAPTQSPAGAGNGHRSSRT